MGCARAAPTLLNILNAAQVVIGLGLAVAAVWFYVEVQSVTGMRNRNHYLLDYNVYWPQAIPFVFIFVGIFTICVSFSGFVSVRKRNKSLVLLYVIFVVISMVFLLAAAIISFVFAESRNTEQFIVDAIYDVFGQSKSDNDIQTAFGVFERRLQCCGAKTPRDYVGWRTEFPISCCDTYYHGLIGSYNIDCDFSSKSANSRFGCSEVAVKYTKITIHALAAVASVMAIIAIINLSVGVTLWRSLKRRPRFVPQQELETNRVLL